MLYPSSNSSASPEADSEMELGMQNFIKSCSWHQRLWKGKEESRNG